MVYHRFHGWRPLARHPRDARCEPGQRGPRLLERQLFLHFDNIAYSLSVYLRAVPDSNSCLRLQCRERLAASRLGRRSRYRWLPARPKGTSVRLSAVRQCGHFRRYRDLDRSDRDQGPLARGDIALRRRCGPVPTEERTMIEYGRPAALEWAKI